jgi:hypothetical protein
MGKVVIDPCFLQHIRTVWADTDGRAERTALIEHAALTQGVSVKTMYRKLNLNSVREKPRKKRSVSDDVAAQRAIVDQYAQEVFRFAMQNSYDHSVCSYRLAFNYLQRMEKRIPPTITEQQIYKSISRQCLENEWQPVAKRFERQHPLSMVQLDFSKSRHIKHIGGGRLMLKNPTATKIAPDRRSLWVGCAIDDCSRVAYMEYFITEGESAFVAQEFLIRSFTRKPTDPEIPNDFLLQGMPREIYVDRGSGWMSGETQIGLAKLGIKCIIGANEKDQLGRKLNRSNKKARGKVERMIKTFKENFEMELSLKYAHRTEFTLGDLNNELREWIETFNQMAHPQRRDEGKWNIFREVLETASYPKEDAASLFSKRILKKVVKRKINVDKGYWCIAPKFLNDGDLAEIVFVDGKHHVVHADELVPLAYEDTPYADPKKIQGFIPAEHKRESDDMICDNVNRRFSEAIESLTDGEMNIRSIPTEIWETIESWFEKPRTVGAVKAKALEVSKLLARSTGGPMPSNVIQL